MFQEMLAVEQYKNWPIGCDSISNKNFINGTKKLPAITASASKDSLNFTHISLTNIDPSKDQNVTIKIGASGY